MEDATSTGIALPQQKPHKKLSLDQIVKRVILILAGSAVVAVGLELFLVPNNIIDGGITGISIMASYLTKVPLGVYLFFLNLPFLYWGYKQMGKTFALSTLLGVTGMSVCTQLLRHVEPVTHDPLLATVFGGLVLGVGVGTVIRYGGSLDGTEIVAILFSRKSAFSVGEIVMFINMFILASAGLVFGWERAMYSIMAYYIAYKTIDLVLLGFDESKAVWIISDKAEEIGNAILHRLGRGVTYLLGEGAYTGAGKKVIFCVIMRLEESKLHSLVDELDPNAFLAIGSIHDVKGGRFKKRNIH